MTAEILYATEATVLITQTGTKTKEVITAPTLHVNRKTEIIREAATAAQEEETTLIPPVEHKKKVQEKEDTDLHQETDMAQGLIHPVAMTKPGIHETDVMALQTVHALIQEMAQATKMGTPVI